MPSSRLVRTSTLTAAALCAGLLAAPQHAAATDDGVRIHDVQGNTRISPLLGERVGDVPGIVTAVREFGSARGFWLQDRRPDGDPATSEAVYVHTGGETPDVEAGDELRLDGTVAEYYPGGKEAGGQSVTQLTEPEWTVRSQGNSLPAAHRLDARTVPTRYAPQAEGGSIEDRRLRPGRYALDRYESLEGMRVAVTNTRVVGPTSAYDDLWVTTDPRQHPTPRGGTLYGSYAHHNSARLKVSSLLDADLHPFPQADVGDVLGGRTEGPLDYEQFGGYTLRATSMGRHHSGGLERERTREHRPDELSVATYNVENLSPATPREKFARLAEGLVENLASPDIVTLEEAQDDSGPEDDGTVSAAETLDALTAAVREAGGPAYEWRQIDPEDNADGGQPGGNIRVAFLFDPERVSFTDRPGGDATTPVRVEEADGAPRLSVSPGRIAPQDDAWEASRKPLAGEFVFRGRTVFVVANHFSSKGGGDLDGDQPMEGRSQPPARHSEPQRIEQARLVNEFAAQVRKVDRNAAVVAGGDFNDFPFSPALDALRTDAALTSPMDALPANERYGYVFNGNSQTLDHLLTSPGAGAADYDIVHLNAEFADQSSDHDPSVVRLRPRR
ncbi:endonuclease/exonuclease/phosphatase family protein [Streptomyces xiaopingdaonensis]|uniref:endonuclease/exonuclease/phosphatase family protein n=1 Tax=Streptomyces xiaopingdaonensis TaxID=1565415 RepID=UPI0002F0C18E|nr:endonuclease/exonuclease/phosphatase family protein [Streptomyces xiaopingdaonensis]